MSALISATSFALAEKVRRIIRQARRAGLTVTGILSFSANGEVLDTVPTLDASPAGPGADPTPTGMRPGQQCTWSVDNCDGHYYSESEEALWIAGKLQAEHGERCPYIEPSPRGGPTCKHGKVGYCADCHVEYYQ